MDSERFLDSAWIDKSGVGQSKIKHSVHPLVRLRNKDGQLFHHVLSLSDRADHAHARGRMPFLRHLFASVATPAFNKGIPRKNAAVDLRQLAVVQPRFAGAIDIAAVVEHKTGSV